MSRENHNNTPTNTPTQNQFTNSELKQIEEMAKALTKYEKGLCERLPKDKCLLTSAIHAQVSCDYCKIAEFLYNAGYRKQSEGEWIDQYNGKYANPIYVCSVCGKGTLLKPHINELNNMEMIQALSPYCPNCGAKMTKGDVD